MTASRKTYTVTEAAKILSESEEIDFSDYDSDTESSDGNTEYIENEGDPETVLLEPAEEVILVDNSDSVPNIDDKDMNITNEVKEKVTKKSFQKQRKMTRNTDKKKQVHISS